MAETDEKEAQLTAYYDKEMGELKGAREEYTALMGGANPTFDELQKFVKVKKQTLAAGRISLGMRDYAMPAAVGSFPYEQWDDRKACCICPPCAACPDYCTFPYKVPLCWPWTICCPGLDKFGNNPCCTITYCCVPLNPVCARPCLIAHPSKCCCPDCCCCCRCETVGCELGPCCHFTCTCMPANGNPLLLLAFPFLFCCKKENITDQLKITRETGAKVQTEGGAPHAAETETAAIADAVAAETMGERGAVEPADAESDAVAAETTGERGAVELADAE